MQLCARASPLRWLMIGLVFWATMINYMDRQALAVARLRFSAMNFT